MYRGYAKLESYKNDGGLFRIDDDYEIDLLRQSGKIDSSTNNINLDWSGIREFLFGASNVTQAKLL